MGQLNLDDIVIQEAHENLLEEEVIALSSGLNFEPVFVT